ncbi:MAG: gamma-glutamyl-gamma-aminobutyrate hydrolase family protein [Victivallales bacterium]|nr:gamma-glutamyl-gamma-aminobutyrate hydrolase family protein [Victivallales bacterium]
MNERRDGKPLIGVNMLYSGLPENRTLYGSMKDFFMVPHLYIEGIINAGGIPLMTPSIEDPSIISAFAERVDGFLFIGGPDYPSRLYGESPHEKNASSERERQDADIPLVEKVLSSDIPVLGICAGAQIINIALGGKLIQHLPNAESHVGECYHLIDVASGSKLGELMNTGECEVNSSHHQALNPDYLPKELVVTAKAKDGTIEAVEFVNHPFRLGLQFHIERHRDLEYRRNVFEAFINAAGRCAIED